MIDYKVSFCIVLYKQPLEELKRVISSILLYEYEKRIYLIDNSDTDSLKVLRSLDTSITYLWLGQNLGFGKANNIAIRQAHDWGSKYHAIVNPDIFYHTDIIAPMTSYMDSHPDVGAMMPQILNPDGTLQYLPKLTPSPWKLFWRKCPWPQTLHRRVTDRFEMRGMKQDRTYDILHVTGCFAIYRMTTLWQVGGFDDRYFMYFEDTDLSRKIHECQRTIYYPLAHVYHDYGNGASKEKRLFFFFIISAFKFFWKWGFLDLQGHKLNLQVLAQLKA